jgi:hypothetical protein
MIRHVDVTFCMRDDFYGWISAPFVFASWFASIAIVGLNLVSDDIFLILVGVGWNLFTFMVVLLGRIIGADKPHPECSPWRSGDIPCGESFSVAFIASSGLVAGALKSRALTKRMEVVLLVMLLLSPVAVVYNEFATVMGALMGWMGGVVCGGLWTVLLHYTRV